MSVFIPLLIVAGFIYLVWKWKDIEIWFKTNRALRARWSAPPANPEDDPDFMRWLNRKYKKK